MHVIIFIQFSKAYLLNTEQVLLQSFPSVPYITYIPFPLKSPYLIFLQPFLQISTDQGCKTIQWDGDK